MKSSVKLTDKADFTRLNFWFRVFYACTFVVLAIIGLFGNSFFAYGFFSSLFFDVLFYVLSVAVFILMSVQNFLKQVTLFGKWFSLIYFNLFAVTIAVRTFIGLRLWAVFLFIALVASIALLMVLAFKYARSPGKYQVNRFCPLFAMLPALLLLMLSVRQSYIGSQGMWIPIVIIGLLFAVASLLVFFKFFSKHDYFISQKSELIASVALIIVAAFMFSGIVVTGANYAFDGAPSAVNVQIADKRISAGARQATSFNFTVVIGGEEQEIEVPVDVYHSKAIGDFIVVKLYNGAFGYGYYIFERDYEQG